MWWLKLSSKYNKCARLSIYRSYHPWAAQREEWMNSIEKGLQFFAWSLKGGINELIRRERPEIWRKPDRDNEYAIGAISQEVWEYEPMTYSISSTHATQYGAFLQRDERDQRKGVILSISCPRDWREIIKVIGMPDELSSLEQTQRCVDEFDSRIHENIDHKIWKSFSPY